MPVAHPQALLSVLAIAILTVPQIAFSQDDGDSVKKPRTTGGRASGGIGSPPSSRKGWPGGDREKPKRPAKKLRAEEEKKNEDESPRKRRARRLTAVMPHPGSYRAPAILRLAAQLYGLPVRVASKALNDLQIEIPDRLARRPLTLDEMRIFLAANSLYLHIWEHPEKGRILVASRDPQWRPKDLRFRKILEVSRGRFQSTWNAVRSSVDAHNARLPKSSPRVVAVPHERTGKIFLWSPRKEWLDDFVAIEAKVDDETVDDRPHLFSHRGRHLRADDLEVAVLKKLSESERKQVRIRVAPWGNHLLYRCDRELAQKVGHLLEQIDRPENRNP